MRVLITRPRPEAEGLARRLEQAGVGCVIEPLLAIRPRPGACLSLEGVQAVLVTSANGARALAGAARRRDVPVYAVGEASAKAARAHGFAAVSSAAGDVEALRRKVVAELDPARGRLVHVAASRRAGDLAGGLEAAGFTLDHAVLYDAVPAPSLGSTTRQALATDALDAVLFFSPRTAEAFVSLVGACGLAAACERLEALCLSPAVAKTLAGLAWRRVRTASRPDQDALLELMGLSRQATR